MTRSEIMGLAAEELRALLREDMSRCPFCDKGDLAALDVVKDAALEDLRASADRMSAGQLMHVIRDARHEWAAHLAALVGDASRE